MCAAADCILGEHDFTSFAAVDPERSRRMADLTANSGAACEQPGIRDGQEASWMRVMGNVRRIYQSEWQRDGDEFIYTVRGNGFLHHMVRNLVGLFLLVGKGTLSPGDIAGILAARRRSANPGATVPASGLHLVAVEYD